MPSILDRNRLIHAVCVVVLAMGSQSASYQLQTSSFEADGLRINMHRVLLHLPTASIGKDALTSKAVQRLTLKSDATKDDLQLLHNLLETFNNRATSDWERARMMSSHDNNVYLISINKCFVFDKKISDELKILKLLGEHRLIFEATVASKLDGMPGGEKDELVRAAQDLIHLETAHKVRDALPTTPIQLQVI